MFSNIGTKIFSEVQLFISCVYRVLSLTGILFQNIKAFAYLLIIYQLKSHECKCPVLKL